MKTKHLGSAFRDST